MTSDGLASHVIERALERYGIVITWQDVRDLEARIHAGDGVMLLRRNPDGAEVSVVRVDGQLVTLVYSPLEGRIKTFLPADKPMTRRRPRI